MVTRCNDTRRYQAECTNDERAQSSSMCLSTCYYVLLQVNVSLDARHPLGVYGWLLIMAPSFWPTLLGLLRPPRKTEVFRQAAKCHGRSGQGYNKHYTLHTVRR